MSAPSRLHVTLCDLGRATPRAYGGVGFGIREPRIRTRVTIGNGNVTLPTDADEALFEAVTALVADLKTRANGTSIDVHVETMPAQHAGLGTKTAVLLSVIFGTNRLLSLGLSTRDMQLMSGRGGTSGVGVHSFFSGGLIWDAGHRQSEIMALGPSRFHRPQTIPPCLTRLDMPAEWVIGLLQPEGIGPSGAEELDLFSRVTPLPTDETLELISLVAHGLVPAIAERNLRELSVALDAITRTGFKAREVAEQSDEVKSLLFDLQAQSIPAGMSSLGPAIFAVVAVDDQETHDRVEAIALAQSANLRWTQVDNEGVLASLNS